LPTLDKSGNLYPLFAGFFARNRQKPAKKPAKTGNMFKKARFYRAFLIATFCHFFCQKLAKKVAKNRQKMAKFGANFYIRPQKIYLVKYITQ